MHRPADPVRLRQDLSHATNANDPFVLELSDAE